MVADILKLSLGKLNFSEWSYKINEKLENPVHSQDKDHLVLCIDIFGVLSARNVGMVEAMRLREVVFLLNPASETFHHPVQTSNTSSEISWQQIEAWIERCKNSCGCVNIGRRMKIKPARLIDIGEKDDDLLHIRSASKLPAECSYVCLSHCWGGKVMCSLQDLSRPPSFAKGLHIPSSSIDGEGFRLPNNSKTFRDAVKVTRRLGIRHLWIDSLRIIQNDSQDWETESSFMGRTYFSAALTLIADGARNGTEGLFFNRSPAAVSPMIAKPKWTIEHSKKFWSVVPVDFWNEAIAESVTGRRAWCLQERWLSRVKIHFGHQIMWECGLLDCCETFPAGLPQELNAFKGMFLGDHSAQAAARLKELGLSSKKTGNGVEEDLLIYYIWAHLIERYMLTDITMQSDRIPAIFGLAEWMSILTKDVSTAGLWESIMPSQLLWTVDAGMRGAMIKAEDFPELAPWQPPGKRNFAWHAPTWSWTSLEGPILLPKPTKQDIMIVANLMPSSDQPVGSLAFQRSAWLVITGTLHRGWLFWNSRYGRWSCQMNAVGFGPRQSDIDGGKVDLDRGELYTQTTDQSLIAAASAYEGEPAQEDVRFGLAQPDTDILPGPGESKMIPCFFVPILRTRGQGKTALHDDANWGFGHAVSGLLVSPSNNDKCIYMRIGVFDLLGDEEKGIAPKLYVSYENDGQDELFVPESERKFFVV